jgi:replicative DNA helicase
VEQTWSNAEPWTGLASFDRHSSDPAGRRRPRLRIATESSREPTRLHDLDAEGAVLSHLLLHPDAIAGLSFLRPEYFYSDSNRLGYAAIVDMAESGTPIDVPSVRVWLEARGRLHRVGGAPYLVRLLDEQPAIAGLEQVAEHLVGLWQQRRLRDLCHEALARPQEPCADVGALIESVAEHCNDLQRQGVNHRPPCLRDRLLANRDSGPRHSTGFAPLDGQLRGGLRPGNLVVLGGPPGSGKTTLAANIAAHLSRSGVAVGWLAVDEECSGIDVRRLQAIGVSREQAEQPDDATIEHADEQLGRLPFEMFDQDHTVESLFLSLARLYPNQPRVVVIDSVQSARTTRSLELESPRERVDELLGQAKRLATQPDTQAIVLFTSELARASYGPKGRVGGVEDIAAFKESGGIEYQATVLLMLKADKEHPLLIHVSTPKNRVGGTKASFDLLLDPETAVFAPQDPCPADDDAERCRRFKHRCGRVLDAVREHPGASTSRLREVLNMRCVTLGAALEQLSVDNEIVDKGAGRTHRWWAAGPPSQAQGGVE